MELIDNKYEDSIRLLALSFNPNLYNFFAL